MAQLQLFTAKKIVAMRDRRARRNYSPAAEDFRREHERHRAWGLSQRHALRLRRARTQALPRVHTDLVPEAHLDFVPGPCVDPVPECCVDPVPEFCADPVPESCADPVPESCADPVPESCADPAPESCADPAPESYPDFERAPQVQARAHTDALSIVETDTPPETRTGPNVRIRIPRVATADADTPPETCIRAGHERPAPGWRRPNEGLFVNDHGAWCQETAPRPATGFRVTSVARPSTQRRSGNAHTHRGPAEPDPALNCFQNNSGLAYGQRECRLSHRSWRGRSPPIARCNLTADALFLAWLSEWCATSMATP
ncbi:hypothetical protein J5X75_08945 [Actinoplanes sp. NEAU-H7]|uniref:Uncharacterized protein n=1 Tax=Actinoplanes flavus TaxID=2820290 RepID=A0ABS3UFU4_9ACTN|nr:hypothetical protein [Actinoplanes flavus]